jgi:putative oxidoreductase
MASAGLPFASVLLVLTIVVEVGGGAALIMGIGARWAALALALFLIPATFTFHAFWAADAAHFQDQLTAFMKNLAIFGGMLLVIERGFRKGN